MVQPGRQAERPRAVPRDVRPHGRCDAASSDAIERVAFECAQRSRCRRRRLRRGPHGPRVVHSRQGLDARRGHGRDPRRDSQRGSRGHRSDDLRDLPSAMRTAAHSLEIAQLAVKLSGPRRGRVRHRRCRGRLPTDRATSSAFQYVMRENFHSTIHAGEAFGLPVDLGSPAVLRRRPARSRRAHRRRRRGRRRRPDAMPRSARWRTFVRDRRIPLELCPTSNVNTGVVRLDRRTPHRHAASTSVSGSRSTPTTALMSDTSMTKRDACSSHEAFGWGSGRTSSGSPINAMKSAFAPFPERLNASSTGLIKPPLRTASTSEQSTLGAI